MGGWCVPSAPNPFTHAQSFVAAIADRGCRSQRLLLQLTALQKNCTGVFHFIERAIDVAMLKLNSAAAIDDDVRVQSEAVGVERAVFDAVVQRQAHQVNVFDSALPQILGKAGVTAMGVVEKRAIAVDHRIGSLVENMSD